MRISDWSSDVCSSDLVILPDAYITARIDFGSALADQNVAGNHFLPAVTLHAKTAASGITTVARRTACFFMCHIWLLLASRSGCGGIAGGFDFGFGRGLFRLLRIADGHDPQDRELLAMAVAPEIGRAHV